MKGFFINRFLKVEIHLMAVAVFLAFSSSWSEELWQPADADTSFGHLPAKIINDLPHLFISGNIVRFAAGSVATVVDRSVLDGQNRLPHSVDGLNIEPAFDFGTFYGGDWVEGAGALGSWGAGTLTGE